MTLAAAIVIDANSIIKVWGKSCEDIFGLTKEQAVGKTLLETIIPPRYQLAHLRGIRHYIDTGAAPIVGEAIQIYGLWHAPDGTTEEIPIMLSISVLPVGSSREDYEFSAVVLYRGR